MVSAMSHAAEIMLEVEGILEDVLAEVFRKRVCPMLEYLPNRGVRLVLTTLPLRFRGGADGGDLFYDASDPGRNPEFTWKTSGPFSEVVHRFRFDFLGNLDARALECYVLFGIYREEAAATTPAPAQSPESTIVPSAPSRRPMPLSSVAIVPMEEITPPQRLAPAANGRGEGSAQPLTAIHDEDLADTENEPNAGYLAQVIDAAPPDELADAGEEVPEDLYQPLPAAEVETLDDEAFPAEVPPPAEETTPQDESLDAAAKSVSWPPVPFGIIKGKPLPPESEFPVPAAPDRDMLVDEGLTPVPPQLTLEEWANLLREEEKSAAESDEIELVPDDPWWDAPPQVKDENLAENENSVEAEEAENAADHASASHDNQPEAEENEDAVAQAAARDDAQPIEAPALHEPLKVVEAPRATPSAAVPAAAVADVQAPEDLPGNLYQDFFGFETMPFNNTPDTQFYFPTRRHQEALARLLYTVSERKGFVLITGEIGCGKSTVCREMLGRLPQHVKTAMITHTHLSATQLLRSIAEDLGLSAYGRSRYEILQLINTYLVEQHAAGSTVCIIIDEAQNLDADTLEEVRMISNLETEQEKLVQIILLAQPEMRQKIMLPELKQLRQRISVQYHLQPLTPSETVMYIRHRLKVAAPAKGLEFKRSAMLEAHRFSGGVPRLLNNICDNALLTAFTHGKRRVTNRMIREAARDLNLEHKYGRIAAWFRKR